MKRKHVVKSESIIKTINRSYRVELAPNRTQLRLLYKSCNVSRWAYNWGLAYSLDLWRTCNKSVSAIELHKEAVRLKQELPEGFGWLYEVSKCCVQEALRDLDKAYANYFRGIKQNKQVGKPKFKRRKWGRGSFRLTGTIKLYEDYIQLPTLGKVKLKEQGYLPFDNADVNINSVTVVNECDRWYVSVNVVEEMLVSPTDFKGKVVGIDMGLTHLVITSDGVKYENPKHLRKVEHKLKRLQRRLAHKAKGSKNRLKAIMLLQRCYRDLRNMRKDGLHKVTSELARAKSVCLYVVEDLNVSGMVKNHKLAKSISDASWYEFTRMLEYKCEWNGVELVKADRFFASSKLCSECGSKKEDLKLSERIYVCECGATIDRDINAAKNLSKYGEDYLLKIG